MRLEPIEISTPQDLRDFAERLLSFAAQMEKFNTGANAPFVLVPSPGLYVDLDQDEGMQIIRTDR